MPPWTRYFDLTACGSAATQELTAVGWWATILHRPRSRVHTVSATMFNCSEPLVSSARIFRWKLTMAASPNTLTFLI
ncbi:hypothetical protein BON30_40860 [Cystobacter ferrugineus]|uniref:Uncharacterized protein n=1 Tax=Cystobacter ferrugineus TaxID=83449 RepID=A0A1L9AY52_9BACT|nr:hypothetical protein BON30_40860 [Cystobacter ferrugineus]